MLHTFFVQPKGQRQILEGRLGVYVCDHTADLNNQGYSRNSIQRRARLIAGWGQWIQKRSIAVDDLNDDCITRYLRYRYGSKRPDYCDRPALDRFLAWLREKGIIRRSAPSVIPTQEQQEENAFQFYLYKERGLCAGSVANHLLAVRRFLKDRFGHCPIRLSQLCAKDIIRHIQRQASQLKPDRMRTILAGLRAFLHYLRHQGIIAEDLAACVPKVASWKQSTLPKFIEAADVQKLLRSCKKSTSADRRNYAILLLLARLGLRGGEIVGLQLEDLDWAAGELTIRGKGGRIDRLPLPHDVGRAIAGYLKKDRPTCMSRHVFIRLLAPHRSLKSSRSVSEIVRDALKTAGVEAPRTGAHLLRHSLATSMLGRGASLQEIAQLLRHRQVNTTTIYAKVDLISLRGLAQPWPGGTR